MLSSRTLPRSSKEFGELNLRVVAIEKRKLGSLFAYARGILRYRIGFLHLEADPDEPAEDYHPDGGENRPGNLAAIGLWRRVCSPYSDDEHCDR